MTINELRKKRISLVLEALNEGMSIPYKKGWFIYLEDSNIYQTIFSHELGKDVKHKSSLTLNDFLEYVFRLSDEELKMIQGSVTLLKYQRNLLENYKDDYIDPREHDDSK
jgi:hypothetical protein